MLLKRGLEVRQSRFESRLLKLTFTKLSSLLRGRYPVFAVKMARSGAVADWTPRVNTIDCANCSKEVHDWTTFA